MTSQTKFYCSNCNRWKAVEITRQVAHHERRAFRCEFCGHCFTENQSVAEYEAAVADHDALEAGDDSDAFDMINAARKTAGLPPMAEYGALSPMRQIIDEERPAEDDQMHPICELCGYSISSPSGLFDTHGYGECVDMPDNFCSIYFDELRHRGVALMAMVKWHSRVQWQYPREIKMRAMLMKAYALANAYYAAKRESLTAIFGDEGYWHIHNRLLARIEVPSYEMMRSMLLDGDFTDDGNVEGGDYILACRVALQVTADRYRPV